MVGAVKNRRVAEATTAQKNAWQPELSSISGGRKMNYPLTGGDGALAGERIVGRIGTG